MKSLKLLIAYVAILFAMNANAQTVLPGFQSQVYGGWAHPIRSFSVTVKQNVTDLAGQPGLLRTVDRRQFGNVGPWTQIDNLSQAIGLGVDQFDVPIPTTGIWSVMLHNRYLTDPDGPGGPLHAGDDVPGFPVLLELVQVHPDPGLSITWMEMAGPVIDIQVTAVPYSASGNVTHLIVQVVNMDIGQTVFYDSTNVEPGWPTGYYTVYPIFAGNYCVYVRMRYTNDGPGNQADFIGELIDEDGPICLFCNGLSTGVGDHDGPKPCCMKPYPNPATPETGWTVTIDGNFDQSLGFQIYGPNGQLVRDIPPPQSSIFTMDVSDFASGAYMVRQGGDRACTIIVQH